MDDETKLKIVELETRFDEKFKQLDKRVTFLGAIPQIIIGCVTIILIGIGFLNFGQVNTAISKIDEFTKSFPNEFQEYKNNFEKDVESKIIGDPNQSRIKVYHKIGEPLSGKVVPAYVVKNKDAHQAILQFVLNNYSDYGTDELLVKVYFGETKDGSSHKSVQKFGHLKVS